MKKSTIDKMLEKESPIEVKEVKSVEPFVMPEKVVPTGADRSKVDGLPDHYVGRWVHKSDLANNRKGYWVVVNKKHDEFKDVRVSRDDTPDETFFTRGDLVLCVMHKDTFQQLHQQHLDRTAARAKRFDAQSSAVLDQIAKEGIDSVRGGGALSKVGESD